ncbi:MAG: hypothetical protein WD042_11935 [Phycisphaeraceae bacterium]
MHNDSPCELLTAVELAQLELTSEAITSVEVIGRRRVNTIYRIHCDGRWHVLKRVERPEISNELLATALYGGLVAGEVQHRSVKVDVPGV